MALVNINGHVYYTQSLRLGKWVTSACLAKGKLAFVMAEMQAELKREQQEERAAWEAEQRELVGAYKAARKAERAQEKAAGSDRGNRPDDEGLLLGGSQGRGNLSRRAWVLPASEERVATEGNHAWRSDQIQRNGTPDP